MSKPKLHFIPSAYKAGKIYSPIPFNGDGDGTFSRTTTGTRIDSNGLITTIGTELPRLNYVSGSTSPALLIEPQSTNLILNSEDFTGWTKAADGTATTPVITANQITAPDGTTTADKVDLDRGAGNTSSDRSFIVETTGISTSGDYTISAWVKAVSGDEGKEIAFRFSGGAGATTYVPYTLTSEWVRITYTATVTYTSGSISVNITDRGGITTGNQVSFYIWGIQVEENSVATSYIKTTSSTVTRTQDNFDFKQLQTNKIIEDKFTVMFNLEETYNIVNVISAIYIGASANNSFSIRYTGDRWYFRTGNANNVVNEYVLESTYNPLRKGKYIIKYNSNLVSVFRNGVKLWEDTPNYTPINFENISSNTLITRINEIQLFDSALSDAECITLSTL